MTSSFCVICKIFISHSDVELHIGSELHIKQAENVPEKYYGLKINYYLIEIENITQLNYTCKICDAKFGSYSTAYHHLSFHSTPYNKSPQNNMWSHELIIQTNFGIKEPIYNCNYITNSSKEVDSSSDSSDSSLDDISTKENKVLESVPIKKISKNKKFKNSNCTLLNFPTKRKRSVCEKNESPWYCELCQILCPSEYNYLQHIKGKKHIQHIAEPESFINKVISKCKNDDRYFCDICSVNCVNEFNYNTHMAGIKHRVATESKEVAVKPPFKSGYSKRGIDLEKHAKEVEKIWYPKQ